GPDPAGGAHGSGCGVPGQDFSAAVGKEMALEVSSPALADGPGTSSTRARSIRPRPACLQLGSGRPSVRTSPPTRQNAGPMAAREHGGSVASGDPIEGSTVYPAGSRVDERGHLELAGCDVVELAEELGTPAYLYAEEDMRARARAYREAFAARSD